MSVGGLAIRMPWLQVSCVLNCLLFSMSVACVPCSKLHTVVAGPALQAHLYRYELSTSCDTQMTVACMRARASCCAPQAPLVAMGPEDPAALVAGLRRDLDTLQVTDTCLHAAALLLCACDACLWMDGCITPGSQGKARVAKHYTSRYEA